MKICVVEGDIAQIPADALLTAVNSGGLWMGGIDAVIERVASDQFHRQAAAALKSDSDVKVVVAHKCFEHRARFENVVFTIDDLDEPLVEVVLRGLNAAAEAGYRSVTMPAIRLGVMRNVGGSQSEKVRDMVRALREHERSSDSPLDEVKVVIYGDSALAREFNQELA